MTQLNPVISLNLLPPELVYLIVQHVHRQTLCAVIASCKLLRPEGERLLYSTSTGTRRAKTHIKFLTTILERPQLALYVHVYFFYDVHFSNQEEKDVLLGGLLSSGLRSMVNLKELRFATLSRRLRKINILNGCAFQLQKLIWDRVPGDQVEDFIRCLDHQQQLKHLHVRWSKDPNVSIKEPSIPPEVCPKLVSLKGNIDTIQRFLPGRTIEYLRWTSDTRGPADQAMQAWPILTSSFSQLRILSIDSHNYPIPLACLCAALRSLEILEVQLLFIEDLELLATLANLETLLISQVLSRQETILFSEWAENGTAIQDIFTNCKKLRNLFVWEGERYDRWCRRSGQIVRTSASWGRAHSWLLPYQLSQLIMGDGRFGALYAEENL